METHTQTVQVLGQKGPDVLQEQIDIAESVSERHRDTRNMKQRLFGNDLPGKFQLLQTCSL